MGQISWVLLFPLVLGVLVLVAGLVVRGDIREGISSRGRLGSKMIVAASTILMTWMFFVVVWRVVAAVLAVTITATWNARGSTGLGAGVVVLSGAAVCLVVMLAGRGFWAAVWDRLVQSNPAVQIRARDEQWAIISRRVAAAVAAYLALYLAIFGLVAYRIAG